MKKFVAILLTLVLVLSLAACSPQQTEQKKIGGLLATLSFDFQIQMNKGLERAAKENGYEYVVYDYNCDSEQMLTGLETLHPQMLALCMLCIWLLSLLPTL